MLISQALQAGYDVISDDTNLKNYICRQLVTVAAVAARPVEWVVFDTPLQICIARDAKRSNPVGKGVIKSIMDQTEQLEATLAEFPMTIVYPGDQYRDPRIGGSHGTTDTNKGK